MTRRIDYEHIATDGMKALGGVYGYIAQCGLPDILIAFAYLRVSLINGCAYCVDMHTRELARKDVPFSKIALVSVWREAGEAFSSQERAALEWAETLTHISDTRAPDVIYRAVAAHFSEKEMVDLTIAIGLMNLFNRLAIGFGRGPVPHS